MCRDKLLAEAVAGILAIDRACHQAQAQAHESVITDQATIIANLWTVIGWTGFLPEQVRSLALIAGFVCISLCSKRHNPTAAWLHELPLRFGQALLAELAGAAQVSELVQQHAALPGPAQRLQPLVSHAASEAAAIFNSSSQLSTFQALTGEPQARTIARWTMQPDGNARGIRLMRDRIAGLWEDTIWQW